MSFFENYSNSKWFYVFDILYKLLILNLVFVLYTYIGLVVFTFFPAYIAMNLLIIEFGKNKEFSIIKLFTKVILKEYFKAQKIFLVVIIVGILFAFNTYFFYQMVTLETASMFVLIGFWVSVILDVLYIASINHLPYAYIYFPHLSTFKTIKISLLMTMGYFIHSLTMVFIFIVTFVLILLINIYLVPFVLFAIPTYFNYRIINKKYVDIVKNEKVLDIECFEK